MARRQDSGSGSAHQNETPTPHNEDAIPEMTDERARASDEVDEYEDGEFEDTEDAGDEGEEGSF